MGRTELRDMAWAATPRCSHLKRHRRRRPRNVRLLKAPQISFGGGPIECRLHGTPRCLLPLVQEVLDCHLLRTTQSAGVERMAFHDPRQASLADLVHSGRVISESCLRAHGKDNP